MFKMFLKIFAQSLAIGFHSWIRVTDEDANREWNCLLLTNRNILIISVIFQCEPKSSRKSGDTH